MAYKFRTEVNGVLDVQIAGSYPIAVNRSLKTILRAERGMSRFSVLTIKVTKVHRVQYEYVVERNFDKASGQGWVYSYEVVAGPFADKKVAEQEAKRLRQERPAESDRNMQLGVDRHRGFSAERRVKA